MKCQTADGIREDEKYYYNEVYRYCMKLGQVRNITPANSRGELRRLDGARETVPIVIFDSDYNLNIERPNEEG